ncbi:MAG: hypothetical protein AAF657_01650 [Acidobacteriota bacterium]
MRKSKPSPLPLAAIILALSLAPPLYANCESGAYLIHTIAEYARLDDTRRWYFRTTPQGEHLRLDATVAHSDTVPRQLTAFLRGPHRDTFHLSRLGERCAPDLEPPGAVTLAQTDNVMVETHYVRFPSCGASDDAGHAVFDRDSKTLHLPTALPISPATEFADLEALESTIEKKIFHLGLRASEGAEATITPDDVDGIELQVLNVGQGEPAFRMIVAVLRLRHLDRLLGSNGYQVLESLHSKLAEFPVIFWQRPGGEPFYVGDGSWCSTYRLSMESSVRQAAETVRNLGPMERFELTAAYDLSGDGQPEILVVNKVVAYYLEADDRLTVMDWQQGC